eukprot:10264441-Heterocapsa_arctica.AAC.1
MRRDALALRAARLMTSNGHCGNQVQAHKRRSRKEGLRTSMPKWHSRSAAASIGSRTTDHLCNANHSHRSRGSTADNLRDPHTSVLKCSDHRCDSRTSEGAR